MASPYQQQGFQRKLIYLGCILALFTGAWLWRQYILADKARDLGVRDVNQGDVELSGQLVRLTLTGSRGLATCVLWMMAIDDQRKNQWTELEQKVDTLTQLQPHFVTPWLFQSWNLSYNVSVELDRSSDKYFYIARGIQLLARGERQNRYNPDMRWSIGFTYQGKICLHDETNVLRSLFQLSCIPPNQRDRNRFYTLDENGKEQFNWKEFEAFCQENPQLIRRLNNGIQRDSDRDRKRQFLCQTPEALVQFLADNYKIVSPYETPPASPPGGWKKKADLLKDAELDRFPVLPPAAVCLDRPGPVYDSAGLTSSSPLDDGVDGYLAARSWYGYAVEPLPPPSRLIPGECTEVEDLIHQRKPKGMMSSIFRQYPARAASYMAERLQQEGWFDNEPWPIPLWFKYGPGGHDPKTGRDFFSDGKTLAEVRDSHLSSLAWKEAYFMWERDGVENLMRFPDEAARKNKEDLADAYRKYKGTQPGDYVPDRRKEDFPEQDREQLWEEYQAAKYMRMFKMHTQVTNFEHHYQRALVEQKPETVQARKRFYQADTLRINADPRKAIKVYEEPAAMAAWRKILLNNNEFRNDSMVQEDTAEVELKYFDLIREEFHPKPWAFPLPVRITANNFPRSLVNKPFLDEGGHPIVTRVAMDTIEQRRVRPGQKAESKPVEAEPKKAEAPK